MERRAAVNLPPVHRCASVRLALAGSVTCFPADSKPFLTISPHAGTPQNVTVEDEILSSSRSQYGDDAQRVNM